MKEISPYNLALRDQNYPHISETLRRDGYLCRMCKTDVNVIVHHIDESRNNPNQLINNSLSNLMSLCRKCHAKVHKSTKPGNSKRDIVFVLRESGFSFTEIGKMLDITRQRAHQLYHKNPY